MNEYTVHQKKAIELFKCGHNCAQAVLCAFCDETKLDMDVSLKIGSSFGGGMGRLREVCGAVSAMFMIAGMKRGYSDLNDKGHKDMHYKLIQELADRFKAETGSIVCRELLKLGVKRESPVSEERSEKYYKKRPCAELVGLAARIVDEELILKSH